MISVQIHNHHNTVKTIAPDRLFMGIAIPDGAEVENQLMDKVKHKEILTLLQF